MTLEATTEYGRKIPRTLLNQWINVDYWRKGILARVHLNKTIPLVSMEVRVRLAVRHTGGWCDRWRNVRHVEGS